MRHFLLFYTAEADDLQRRPLDRDDHLSRAGKAKERDELLFGGAPPDAVDGAVLLYRRSSPEVALRFAREDSYVNNRPVSDWKVREWTTVVGGDAVEPVRPEQLG